jgi:hypothetical protein
MPAKRTFLVILAAALLCAPAASAPGALGPDIKLYGGATSSWYSEPPDGLMIPEVSFAIRHLRRAVAGIGVDLPLNRLLSLDFGIQYIGKGTRAPLQYQNGPLVERHVYKLDQVSVPVGLKLRFLPESTPYVVAGGELAYVLSHKLTVYSDPMLPVMPYTVDLKGETRRTDLSAMAGAGIEVVHKRLCMFAEARYYLGLANLNNGAGGYLDDYPTIKTRAFCLVAGIKARLR